MIVSFRHNFIFVHPPKTGGTSVTRALEQRVGADDIILADTPKGKKRGHRYASAQSAGRLWKHSTLADVTGLVSTEFIHSAAIIATVRNPWDRIVSMYFWGRAQSFAHPMVAAAKELTFDAFVRDARVQQPLRNQPQCSYWQTSPEVAPHLLRFESLETDLAGLREVLGFAPPELPHENASDRSVDYRTYYTDENAEIVADLCAKDIELFGYRF